MGSVSPLDDIDAGRIEIPLPIPPSSLPLDLSCSHSGTHSDSSQSECSEGDGGDVTPCNLSPSIRPLVSVNLAAPHYRSLSTGSIVAPHILEDIDHGRLFFFYKDLLFKLKLLVHVFDDTILKETILLNTLRNLVID